jgi:hypothetical protein
MEEILIKEKDVKNTECYICYKIKGEYQKMGPFSLSQSHIICKMFNDAFRNKITHWIELND